MKGIKSLLVLASLLIILCTGQISLGGCSDSIVKLIEVEDDSTEYLRESCVIGTCRFQESFPVTIKARMGNYSLVLTDGRSLDMIPSSLLSPKSSESLIKYKQDGDKGYYVAELKKGCTYIPENIKRDFANENWYVHLTSEDLGKLFKGQANAGISGATVYSEECIKLRQDLESIRDTLGHEIGHYLDSRLAQEGYDYISDSEEWQIIYQQEKEVCAILNASRSYAIKDSKEYFAECVQQCLRFPDSLKESAPLSYSFCLACIASL